MVFTAAGKRVPQLLFSGMADLDRIFECAGNLVAGAFELSFPGIEVHACKKLGIRLRNVLDIPITVIVERCQSLPSSFDLPLSVRTQVLQGLSIVGTDILGVSPDLGIMRRLGALQIR